MNLEQFGIFLNRYANNKSSPEEKVLYEDFFDTYQQVVTEGILPEEQERLGGTILSRIQTDIRPRRSLSFPVFLKAAAAVLILFVGGYYLHQSAFDRKELVVVTGNGEKREVLLSDGTVVVLNAGSRLSYPEQFTGKTRDVNLEGEAYFKVARNEHQPFNVFTASLQTTVLGTSFNIAAYKNELNSVTVLTGKVRVAVRKSGATAFLYPNQQVSELIPGQLQLTAVDAVDYTSWDKGVLYLRETPLPVLARKLERKYNISIRLAPELAGNKCLFNGKLADDKLQNVLENLHFMSQMEYTRVNDSVISINHVSCK